MAFDPTLPYGIMADARPQLFVQGGTIYKSTDFSTVADPTAYIFTTSGSGQGTAGQVLTSNGAGSPPTFQTLSAGSGITALTGDVTASGPGSSAATVVKIGGVAVGTLATQSGTFSGTSSGTNTGDQTAANPTGTIALTAVNGSAATFMRSDGAPALGVGIVPTWTGVHTWSLAEPRLILSESDQGIDLKAWDFDLSAGVLTGRTRTDADAAGKNWLSVTRGTTTAISNISFGNATDNPTFSFLGSGTFAATGGVANFNTVGTTTVYATTNMYVAAATPVFSLYASGQAANLKAWVMNVSGLTYQIGTALDGTFSVLANAALAITRGATTAIASLSYGNATDNPTFTNLGTGSSTFGGNVIAKGAYCDQSYSKQVPTTGFTITIANNTRALILDPAGTLATGTINMPATPVDGQIVTISSTQIQTALTISGNGKTMADTISTFAAAGGSVTFQYVLANTSWYIVAH